MRPTNIIVLTDNHHKGDDNNALGINTALQSILNRNQRNSNVTIAIQENIDEKIENNDNPIIVIGAGEHNIEILSKLKATHPNKQIYVIWSGHQIADQLIALEDSFDFVCLPTHIVDEKILDTIIAHKGKLIQTIGVPHNLQIADIESEYKEGEQQIIPSDKYIMAVLGGDAPTQDEILYHYSPEEAKALGEYLGEMALKKNAVIIATNGPRTGKYEPTNNNQHIDEVKIANDHRGNEIDEVSKAFIRGLENKGLIVEKNFQFFDFKFGESSAYKPLLGCIYSNGGNIFVPGESTSMCSEICSLFPAEQVVIYQNNAMNKGHQSYIDSLCNNGCTNLLGNDLTLTYHNSHLGSVNLSSCAANTVAIAIIDLMNRQAEMHESSQIGATPPTVAAEEWSNKVVSSEANELGKNYPW